MANEYECKIMAAGKERKSMERKERIGN